MFPLLVEPSRGDMRKGLTLTSTERGMLRTVFDFTNRIFVAGAFVYPVQGSMSLPLPPTSFPVDEAHFYAVAHEVGPLPESQHALSKGVAPSPPTALAFRACCAMLLSIGSRLRGQHAQAAGYLAEARRAIGTALVCEPPSQLLISSLLLLVMTASAGLELDGEASRHANMAYSLLPFIPSLRNDIRLQVCVVRRLHSSFTAWPPLQATIGQ